MFLLLILLPLVIFAQNNIIYEVEKSSIKLGKYEYLLTYEWDYSPEGKKASFSEVLIKGNRKQYLGHFVYQLKSSTEMRISPHNPPPIQIENKILQSSSSDFDTEKEQIIVTTFYYDEKEPKEKEIKILQHGKKGFFFLKYKETYYKNGEKKVEKDLPEKIEYVKTHL